MSPGHPPSVKRAFLASTGRVALLLFAAAAAGPPAATQEAVSFHPESPQARYVEWVKKYYPRLYEPDFAELELRRLPPEPSLETPPPTPPFEAGGPISVRLLIRNSSDEGVYSPSAWVYTHNRPQLFRSGRAIPYKANVARLIQQEDVYPPYRSARFSSLAPKQTREEYIDLTDWYEPLEPGRYRLVARHRFIWGGGWLESPPLAFEVVPKKSDAPEGAASTPPGPTGAEARTPRRSATGRRP